jgi:hypothetical protein
MLGGTAYPHLQSLELLVGFRLNLVSREGGLC